MASTRVGEKTMDKGTPSGYITVAESPFSRALFGSTRWAWLWLIARLWLGFDWLQHGWEKFQNPAWTQTGLALKGFWTKAV